jgi:hypothetical protein
MTNQTTPRKRPVWQLVLAVIIAMIAISLFVPQVRASLSTWLGLSVAPSDQVPAPPVTLIPITATPPVNPTLESVGKSASPQAQSVTGQGTTLSGIPDLKQLANQVGWDIFTPGWLPEGYKFQSAHYDPNQKVVFLTYLVSRALPDSSGSSLTATKTISFYKRYQMILYPCRLRRRTNVEDINSTVCLLPTPWEHGTPIRPGYQEPSGSKLISSWRNDLQVQNVYWQDGASSSCLLLTMKP